MQSIQSSKGLQPLKKVLNTCHVRFAKCRKNKKKSVNICIHAKFIVLLCELLCVRLSVHIVAQRNYSKAHGQVLVDSSGGNAYNKQATRYFLTSMNIKVKISIWVVCIGILCMPLHAERSILDSLLVVYESEVAHTNDYLAVRQARIDSLCNITPHTPDLTLAIAREYQSYQSDSARIYYGHLL